MAVHGKGARLLANGYEVTSYTKSVVMSQMADVAETSALQSTNKTYIGGMHDATLTTEGMFDGQAGAVDQVLAAALGQSGSELTYYMNGYAIGDYGYGIQGQESSYEVSSPVDDVTAVTMEVQSSVAGERLRSHQPLAAVTGGGTAASTLDNAAQSLNGGWGYLHCTALTGGTATVKVQHSTDDATYVDLITFTNVTAANVSERALSAGTVHRYTRATWTVTGGTATFQVGFGRG